MPADRYILVVRDWCSQLLKWECVAGPPKAFIKAHYTEEDMREHSIMKGIPLKGICNGNSKCLTCGNRDKSWGSDEDTHKWCGNTDYWGSDEEARKSNCLNIETRCSR